MRSNAVRGLLVCAVAAALAVASLAPAGARERTNSWSGSCSFPGTVYFKPPAKNSDQALSVVFVATGKCSGTLNGKKLSNATVKARHAASAYGGCGGAHTTKTGTGALTFPGGTVIPYTLTFNSVGTEVTFAFGGKSSGKGSGHGSFLTQRTGPDVAMKCATSGTPTAPLDVTFKTDSPFVSPRSGSGGDSGKGGKGRKAKPRLRLRVKPARPHAGTRTTFKFRVRTNRGRRTRATVRFAGRRVRAHHGRARLVLTLHRRGRHVARASKRGYRPARRVVVAR